MYEILLLRNFSIIKLITLKWLLKGKHNSNYANQIGSGWVDH